MDCSTPGFPILHISQSLVKLMSIELVMPPSHLVLCHPFLLLPSIFLSIKVFFNESVLLHQVAKVLELQHQSFSEYSVLISSRIDWFSIPAVQRTLSVFCTTIQKHHFFSTQPSLWSNSHVRTWLLAKPLLCLYRPLLAKWCLCFLNTLSGLVIAFLPRSRHLLISWP